MKTTMVKWLGASAMSLAVVTLCTSCSGSRISGKMKRTSGNGYYQKNYKVNSGSYNSSRGRTTTSGSNCAGGT